MKYLFLGFFCVILPFGKAVTPKNWFRTKDSSLWKTVIHRFATDAGKFCPSPDRTTINMRRQAEPWKRTFQISRQAKFIYSRYDRRKPRKSIRSYPSFCSLRIAFIRIHLEPHSSYPPILGLPRIHRLRLVHIDQQHPIRIHQNCKNRYFASIH